ncbi:MAG: TolC family protein, partial [Pedobacter sp.]
MIKKINLFVLLLSIFSVANAQELLTLQDAITIAMQNNYDIKISKNNINIAKNNANIGNA